MNFKNTKIEWEIVILIQEFKKYISKKDLIELSLLSKLLRVKLKPLLFQKIILNKYKLLKFPGYFGRVEAKWPEVNEPIFSRLMTYTKRIIDRETEFNTCMIYPFVYFIQTELCNHKSYLKELNIFDIGKPFVYIFPITDLFTELTKLILIESHVSLLHFNIVMRKLEKLKDLRLTWVTFIKSTDEALGNQVTFSQSLVNLACVDCYSLTSELPQKPVVFLFNDKVGSTGNIIDLQPQHLQNLTKLSLKFNLYSSHINQWLRLNRQLLEINFRIININEINFNEIAETNTLDKIELEFLSEMHYNTSLNLPILNSIKTLNILKISGRLSLVEKICLSCPMLTKLELEFLDYNEEFIKQLESNLSNLRDLSLNFLRVTGSRFKIPTLVHINRLNVTLQTIQIEEFILPPVMKLNIISILLVYKNMNIEDLIETHKPYTNWKVNLKNDYILFTPSYK